MPQTGPCTDVTCSRELTELYECHCCGWLICLKHLLEHVEISKGKQQAHLDTLTNDLASKSSTLELIMEKKVQEIEREKQLINHAKTIISKPTRTVEELQLISEEINQAIVSNRKEETVVKVEPSLFDMRTCSCTNQISNETNTHRTEVQNLFTFTPTDTIIQETVSPTRRSLRRRTNELEKSTTSKNNDDSPKVNDDSHAISMNDETMDSVKDEAVDNEVLNRENLTNGEYRLNQCPLTFDGAFGLTKANHSLQLCSIDNGFRRILLNHFIMKHKLKKPHAHRLFQAIKHDLDPRTTKLFSENEDVIDPVRHVPCPFSNSMINLIRCCPSQARKVPCSSKSILYMQLNTHVRYSHHLPAPTANRIAKNYRERLSNMPLLDSNDPVS